MSDNLITMLIILTSVFIAALTLAGVIFYFKAKEKLPVFFNFAFGIAAGYALSCGAILLFLTFQNMLSKDRFTPALFWPLFAFFMLVLALVSGAVAVNRLKKEWFKVYSLVSVIAVFIYMICLIFIGGLKSYVYETFTVTDNTLLLLFAGILFVIVTVLPLIFGKKIDDKYNTRAVVFAALCVSLSFALSYLRIFRMPHSGSITYASLLPLMLYAYMFGMRRGVVAGFAYGILQALQDPWIIHPVQFLLDYPLAFAMIGLAGFFKELNLFKSIKNFNLLQFVLGGIFAVVLRYACHVVSGIIVFGEYGLEYGVGAVTWGFLYNTFAFVDMIIALAVGAAMFASKSFKALIPTILPVREKAPAPAVADEAISAEKENGTNKS